MQRTPKNAALSVVGCYVVFGLVSLAISRHLSAGVVLLPLIPALLLGLVFSGYLEIIRTPDGIRFVDARRSAQSKLEASRTPAMSGQSGPQVNINGLPMVNGVDSNGNPFGSTANDPR